RPTTALSVERDLLGRSVANEGSKPFASVHDLVVSPSGQATHLVLSQGGVAGIGTRLVAVPIEKLSFATAGGPLVISETEDQLKAMPEFRYDTTGMTVRS